MIIFLSKQWRFLPNDSTKTQNAAVGVLNKVLGVYDLSSFCWILELMLAKWHNFRYVRSSNNRRVIDY